MIEERNTVLRQMVLLAQLTLCASQTCNYDSTPNQTQRHLNAVNLSIVCNTNGEVDVTWSAVQDLVNILTIQYACSHHEEIITNASGVLLQSSNQMSGRKSIKGALVQTGITCFTWGCFEWNDVNGYPSVVIENKSCTVLAASSSMYGPSNLVLLTTVTTLNSIPVSSTAYFSPMTSMNSNISKITVTWAVLALAAVLVTCALVTILVTAGICTRRWKMRNRYPSPPISSNSNSVMNVDISDSFDVQSAFSSNSSFSPLEYSTSAIPQESTGKTCQVMIYFEPHHELQHPGDSCLSDQSSGYVKVKALQIDGYINANANIHSS